MKRLLPAVFALTLVVSIASAQSAMKPVSTARDGRWAVSLSCADVQTSKGLTRGYAYDFFVDIKGGQLDGRFDESTPPAFVHFAGEVADDGTLFVRVDGLSGAPDATIGKLARGTPYRYTMKGRLDHDRGKAERVELRPCTAEFVRQQLNLRGVSASPTRW